MNDISKREGGKLMGRFKTLSAALCAAVLVTASAAQAQGIVPDRSTIVTIDAPVSLPGIVLPAGSYLFRLADTQASRNVVQIFDKDRSKIFATLIAVSAERNQPSGEAVITFRETPANEPPALRYWYYAGEKSGQEFVYPKDQAMKIARASGESVLAIDSASTDAEGMKSGDINRVDGASMRAEAGANTPVAEQPAAAEQRAAAEEPRQAESTQAAAAAQPATPTPAPTEPAATPAPERPAAPEREPATPERMTAQAPTPAPTTGVESEPRPTGTSGRVDADTPGTRGERELPRTASDLPVVAFLGFLALGGALAVRGLRRRLIV
jgi:hypothetical protein